MVQRSARPARALLQGEQWASRPQQIYSDVNASLHCIDNLSLFSGLLLQCHHAFPDQGSEHIHINAHTHTQHAHTPNIFIAYSTVLGFIPTSIMGFKMPWASGGDTSTEDSALSSAQAAELKSNMEKVRVR
jgi:hypothetical protein